MKELMTGAKAEASTIVDRHNTAAEMGSGSLPVFATPAVVALAEKAACMVLEPFIDDGVTTVGTMMNISHVSASPLGAQITATACLTEIDGRRYVFEVTACDNAGLIAKGTHERFAVRSESFMKKAEAKLSE